MQLGLGPLALRNIFNETGQVGLAVALDLGRQPLVAEHLAAVAATIMGLVMLPPIGRHDLPDHPGALGGVPVARPGHADLVCIGNVLLRGVVTENATPAGLTKSSRSSLVVLKMATGACSKRARYRASLWRSASSACLRSLMSRATNRTVFADMGEVLPQTRPAHRRFRAHSQRRWFAASPGRSGLPQDQVSLRCGQDLMRPPAEQFGSRAHQVTGFRRGNLEIAPISIRGSKITSVIAPKSARSFCSDSRSSRPRACGR